MNKAVFLDKDGTISKDVGYLNDPAKLDILPGSKQAIKKLKQAGYKVIVISNQAGIARGILTENTLRMIDQKLQKEILKSNTFIDAFYYCPHHPDHGIYPYKKKCSCRKPEPGMLLKAAKDHNIDLSRSFMVGDKISDIEAGHKAGAKTILVLTGYGKEHENDPKLKELKPLHIAPDLKNAVEWILGKE